MNKIFYALISTLFFNYAFAVSSVSNNFQVGKTAKIANGYVTSSTRVDGSFESGTTGWSTTSGTIVQTASTEFQGSYKGTWNATGASTLDLAWTSTASNTYEFSFKYRIAGTPDSDHYICAYIGTTETGCTLIDSPSYAPNTMAKAILTAYCDLGQTCNLRIKHTGSDNPSIEIDDAIIRPWDPQVVTTVTQESISITGYTSNTSGKILFANVDTVRTATRTILSLDTSGSYSKINFLTPACFNASSAETVSSVTTTGLIIYHYNSAGTEIKHSSNTVNTNANDRSTSLVGCAAAGDYLYAYFSGATPTNDVGTNFNVVASSTSQNIVQAFASGTEWTPLTYTEINALSGNQGLGTFTAGGYEWKRMGGDILIKGKLTVGTVTGSEARIPLPSGLISADTTMIPSIQVAGFLQRTSATAGMVGATTSILISPSVGYFQMAANTASIGGMTARNGNDLFGSGEVISFHLRVPIYGWSSLPSNILLPSSTQDWTYNLTTTGTNWTQGAARGTVYRTQNGTYHLRYSFAGTLSASSSSINITISGITSRNITGYNQPVTTYNAGSWSRGYIAPNTSAIVLWGGGSTSTWSSSGDIELESKPTFATSTP